MITSIIDAISIAINAEFGSGYEIYTELVEQDIKKGCFFIACIKAKSTPRMGKRYLLENQMVIQYLTSSKEPNAELYRTYDKLIDCLECISVEGNLTRASKTETEILDELLSFTVNYDFEVFKSTTEQQTMETLEVDTSTKGW